MNARFWLILMFSLGFTSLSNPSAVYACSGGSPLTIRGYLAYSDYLIHARVVEVDDIHSNAIVHVESYLAGGSGPTYLLLQGQHPIRHDYRNAGRSAGGDCLGFHPTFSLDDMFYAFVHRNVDGSYGIVGTLFNTPYLSFTNDLTAEVFLEGTVEDENFAEWGTGQAVTEAEFVEIIALESGTVPVSPVLTSNYPLKAPLAIRTSAFSDSYYLLPVDFGVPVLMFGGSSDLRNHALWDYGFSDAGQCEQAGCVHISPNNLDVAIQVNESTLQFTWGHTIQGQAVLFSPPSDVAAVWNDCALILYTTGYPRLGQAWYEITELNSVALNSNNDCSEFRALGIWSPDGRFLAYTDAEGLWLWDVYTIDSPPKVLIEAIDHFTPIARYFSPLGRYLAVATADGAFTLDLRNGARLPDGYISPDDRLLLRFDTTLPSFPLSVCSLTPFSCQEELEESMYIEVLNSSGERESLGVARRITQAAWTSSATFLVTGCLSALADTCGVFYWGPPSAFGGWMFPLFIASGQQFAYDASNDQTAIITGETRLTIERNVLDLQGTIEGSIQDVKWMPSLFHAN